MRMTAFIFAGLSLVLLVSCGTDNPQEPVPPVYNTLEFFVPESVPIDITEEELIETLEEGEVRETPDGVIHVYPLGDPFAPAEFLHVGQSIDDVNYPDLTFQIAFKFGTDAQLRAIMYIYDLSELSPDEVVSFFPEMHEVLVENFGQETESVEKWLNDRYFDDPEMLMTAIENGEYIWVSLWRADEFWVVFDISQQAVIYTNNEYEARQTQEKIAEYVELSKAPSASYIK